MDIWLEKFALGVLAAVFISLVLVNALKFDTVQRFTLGIAALALSIFVARTIQVTRAQTKLPGPPLQTMSPNGGSISTTLDASPIIDVPQPSVQQETKHAGTPVNTPSEGRTQIPTEGGGEKNKPKHELEPSVQINNAPGGFAISGGTVTNPTVNNIFSSRGRLLSEEGSNTLANGLQQLDGTAAIIAYEPLTTEMNRLVGQLQYAFTNGGWQLPAYKSNDGITHHRTVLMDDGPHIFVPDGIHCVGEGGVYNKVLSLLKSAGLNCENASETLYPPPNPAVTITIFIGRDRG